ncbi:signal peptidase I [Agrococcus sp. KRD186]|uniref:signal peptidase I n=1 Tax=Agrococcus sp. KRD186 TaxID=2729730 RepID=UPI0019D11DB6
MTAATEAWKAIGRGLSAGLLLLVLGIGVLTIGVPAVTGGVPLSILTGSMSPSLPAGSLVVVKPTPFDEVQVGDVLTYQLESGQPTLVTHRVTARVADSATGETRFITQGDANEVADAEPVRPVQIRGTVWYAVPLLGWANQFLDGSARQWLVALVAGGLLVYAGVMAVSGVRDRRRTTDAASVTEPEPVTGVGG